MIRRAERFIDKMPFVGKYTIEPAMKGYIRSGPDSEKRKLIWAGAWLGLFVLGHAYQARIGTEAFTFHLEHIKATGDGNDLPLMGLDALAPQ